MVPFSSQEDHSPTLWNGRQQGHEAVIGGIVKLRHDEASMFYNSALLSAASLYDKAEEQVDKLST